MALDNRTPELLAPAGNMTCLHAAVCAGADAVYLGCEDFNARRGADNFTLDNLQEACDYAHLRGVRIYLTLNIAILPEEADRALELARQAWRRGVDAFIIQDIGLAVQLRTVLPQARIHISTQMNTHNLEGVKAAAALGAARITLARECTLEEIAQITDLAAQAGMEVETFCHGAICVCYSGQCFMSSMIGGRSANRGMCAQACRLPYELHNVAVNKVLPAEGEFLLSPKDLCTIDILPQLTAAGVASLKIEGRMKSPEYVSTVVGVYRSALDTGIVTDDQRQALAEAFSRGFTTGYMEHHRGNEMMGYSRPNNRGVFVGRVLDRPDAKGRVAIHCDISLNPGDLLEFWTNKGQFRQQLGDLDFDKAGNLIIKPEKKLTKGDRAFRVRDASLAFQDDATQPRIPIVGIASLIVGQPLTMDFALADEEGNGRWGEDGAWAHFEGAVVEAARTKPVAQEDVAEHIDRLGNTPFALADLSVTVDDRAGIGFSALHKARSQALAALEAEMLAGYHGRTLEKQPKQRGLTEPNPVRGSKVLVAAIASNPACARAAKKAGADVVYVPAVFYKRGQSQVAGQLAAEASQAGYPSSCLISLPVVDKPAMNAEVDFDPWQYVKPGKPVLVENLGQLIRGVEEDLTVEVGPHIPVTNALTLETMAKLGASRVWLSPELTLDQISQLGASSQVPLGLVVAGRQELMTTEHCMLMSQGPCNLQCRECPRRRSPHFLKDRKGYEFPVITDLMGRSHLYNAVETELAHAIPELLGAGIGALMVDTTMMNTEEATARVARVVRARDIALRGGDKVSKAEGCTTGHLFRGVI